MKNPAACAAGSRLVKTSGASDRGRWWAPAAEQMRQQGDDKQHEEDKEQDAGDIDGDQRNPAKAQYRCDNRNNQEDHGKPEHWFSPTLFSNPELAELAGQRPRPAYKNAAFDPQVP
jgi:hypothetical protein